MPKKKQRAYDPNPSTPLDHWSVDVDPAMMSGQYWEREENSPLEKDIGWATEENKDLQKNIPPAGAMFMHPTHDVSYEKDTVLGDEAP
ncbi:DUF3905 domain-containing protein [Caldalkalibacillus mannanilyticus]|uniref:DUF3905 domain-containing protein n=1 Tax=Caldalkalibacillus mannanilyticus TaxID=1418 RepID=UPI00046A8A03|nr:DUF3905 domain-containing protein [Caldalkalibacillus mannanilyticus]